MNTPELVDVNSVPFVAWVDNLGQLNHRVNRPATRRVVASQLRLLADQLERQADLEENR